MKLEEAIRILKIMFEDCDRLNEPHSADALKLGIEALKEIKRLRRVERFDPTIMLPGETK